MTESVARELPKSGAVPVSLAGAPPLELSAQQLAADPATSARINEWLASVDAATRVHWALKNLPGPYALSSSFGAQAAVSLHLVTQVDPDIPVLVIDTGYLFSETYQFIKQLEQQLELNIQSFSSPQSVEDFEAQYGKLWQQGREGLDKYLELRKVEPRAQHWQAKVVGQVQDSPGGRERFDGVIAFLTAFLNDTDVKLVSSDTHVDHVQVLRFRPAMGQVRAQPLAAQRSGS